MPDNTAYLDHAATSPLRPEVAQAIAEAGPVGNASSLHASGRRARRMVEEARESIAGLLGARPSEVIFTGGGTESDNLAVLGTFAGRTSQDPARRRIVCSGIEHHAVLDAVEHLVTSGQAEVSWAEPDTEGLVTASAVEAAIGDAADVALVTCMWANNEVGTVQPVAQIAAVCREAGVPLHTDAVQAVGHLDVNFEASGADLLTLTGHKVGGPTGVGALLVRRDVVTQPLTHGGGQERQLRSGTLDTLGIHGLAAALQVAVGERDAESKRLVHLRDALIAGAQEAVPDIEVGGRYVPGDAQVRLPGNAHLIVPGCEGDSLLYLLDAAGVECSTGSACQAGVPRPSHVLLAMGLPQERARGALRLSLGWSSTQRDVEAFLDALPGAVERARRARAASRA